MAEVLSSWIIRTVEEIGNSWQIIAAPCNLENE